MLARALGKSVTRLVVPLIVTWVLGGELAAAVGESCQRPGPGS
jgi:hypothetical protein